MSLALWNSFENLNTLQEEMESLLGNRLVRFPKTGKSEPASWVPAVDIHEDKEGYHFEVEIPGVDPKAVDVQVEEAVLTIKGARTKNTEEKDRNYHRVEREHGTFTRVFRLPENADTSKVHAVHKDGILKVSIAKKEAAKPIKVEVKSAA